MSAVSVAAAATLRVGGLLPLGQSPRRCSKVTAAGAGAAGRSKTRWQRLSFARAIAPGGKGVGAAALRMRAAATGPGLSSPNAAMAFDPFNGHRRRGRSGKGGAS